MRHFTSNNGTDQCQTVNKTSLLYIESNLDRLLLSLATHDQCSVTKRTNRAPNSFDQQAQVVSQGHTSMQK